MSAEAKFSDDRDVPIHGFLANPVEGQRRTYLDEQRGEWITEEFRDGVWRILFTSPEFT